MDFFSGFVELIKQGGVVMIILILMSILAVAIVIERIWFFQRESSDSKALLKSLGQRVAADDMSGAVKVCQTNKGMLPRIKSFNQEMIVAANQLAEMLHFHNVGEPIPTELYQPVASRTGAASAGAQ